MKRNSTIANRIGAGFVALFFFILPANTFAGVAVSPIQQWVEVKPGRNVYFSIHVGNNKRGPQAYPCPVKVDVLDFTVSPQGKLSFGPEHKHRRSAVEWISFSESEMVLEPGESKEIKFNVSAPADADGDYWAAVMVGLGGSKKPQNGVQVNLQTASGVFVHVARRNYIERGSVIDANVILPEFDIANDLTEKNAWEQVSEDIRKEQVFKVNAELKNDGLVAFLARGKAYLYSEGWRRIATVPLHSSRRRIFPGHTRRFIGEMTQPLPAGQYKLRVFFASDSKYERKITRDMELFVSDDLAHRWAENFIEDDIKTLEVKPQELSLSLTPGRFTAARFQVANRGSSTVATRCRIEADGVQEDWLELKSSDFTLAPNMQRSAVCSVRVPEDMQPGKYNAIIHVEMERSGLTAHSRGNAEQYEIPVSIVVGAPDMYTVSK
jgi:hypothetical protein